MEQLVFEFLEGRVLEVLVPMEESARAELIGAMAAAIAAVHRREGEERSDEGDSAVEQDPTSPSGA